jgi:transcriptional regulator with XRE-family HTH domain
MITNEHYYRAINIMDRVDELREKKGICKTQIGKQQGFTPPYYHSFYNGCRAIRINSLYNIAKVLNVSVEYLLTGKNQDMFKDFKLDFDMILNNDKTGVPTRLRVIKHYLKTGKAKDISVKTLFEFEHYLKIPAIKLIGG